MLLLMLERGAGDYRTPSSRHQPWSYVPAESAMMSRVIAYRRSDRNRADREIAWFDSARPRVQSDQSKARYATLLIARPQRKAQNITISTTLLLSTFGVRRTKAAFPVIFRVNGCFVVCVCVGVGVGVGVFVPRAIGGEDFFSEEQLSQRQRWAYGWWSDR